MKERIQKILASRGVASRRAAEQYIRDGRVTCNGVVCTVGDTADPDMDQILLDGNPIAPKSTFVYVMLNKPRGYVTTMSDEKGRANVKELVADCPVRIYPIGRLDMDSEGLLLFTNDGNLANCLMHPRHEVNKTYRVYVTGFSYEALEKVKEPIVIDGYRIRKPEVALIENDGNRAILSIVIHEGRKRQVRRMCAAAGMYVTRLVRISEGDVRLGKLKTGSWRYLTEAEIQALKD